MDDRITVTICFPCRPTGAVVGHRPETDIRAQTRRAPAARCRVFPGPMRTVAARDPHEPVRNPMWTCRRRDFMGAVSPRICHAFLEIGNAAWRERVGQ